MDPMAVCFFCHKALPFAGKVSFRELCPHCGMDVHVCCNCTFYDTGYANNCREPQAEKVRDAEAHNHCEYFVLAEGAKIEKDPTAEAKAKLDELFRKK